jgi:hypothetical protein
MNADALDKLRSQLATVDEHAQDERGAIVDRFVKKHLAGWGAPPSLSDGAAAEERERRAAVLAGRVLPSLCGAREGHDPDECAACRDLGWTTAGALAVVFSPVELAGEIVRLRRAAWEQEPR